MKKFIILLSLIFLMLSGFSQYHSRSRERYYRPKVYVVMTYDDGTQKLSNGLYETWNGEMLSYSQWRYYEVHHGLPFYKDNNSYNQAQSRLIIKIPIGGDRHREGERHKERHH